MSCQQCCGIEQIFDDKQARKDLKHYRKKGGSKATQLLIQALRSRVKEGDRLLDIGGGIGAIQLELLKSGVGQVLNVDASPAYQKIAAEAAEKDGYKDQVDYLQGDFTELAPEVKPQEIITMDKVICCYPDVNQLLGLAVKRSEKYIGLVYPKDAWWVRFGSRLGNYFMRWRYQGFETFVHPNQLVFGILKENGFKRAHYQTTNFWQVMVWEKV